MGYLPWPGVGVPTRDGWYHPLIGLIYPSPTQSSCMNARSYHLLCSNYSLCCSISEVVPYPVLARKGVPISVLGRVHPSLVLARRVPHDRGTPNLDWGAPPSLPGTGIPPPGTGVPGLGYPPPGTGIPPARHLGPVTEVPPAWDWDTLLGMDLGGVTGVPQEEGHGTSGRNMGWRWGTPPWVWIDKQHYLPHPSYVGGNKQRLAKTMSIIHSKLLV